MIAVSLSVLSQLSGILLIQLAEKNVSAAHDLGWGHCVHLCENGAMSGSDDVPQVQRLDEIRKTWPEIFVNPAISTM